MTVPNALNDPRFRDNPLVTDGLNVRFYVGAPLITPEGVAVGTLCAIDQRPRILTAFQEHCLTMLASEVVALMERRKAHLESGEIPTSALQSLRRQTNTRLNNSLRMVSAISLIIGSSMDPAVMIAATLQAICRHTGWSLARGVILNSFTNGDLTPIEVWRTDESPGASSYLHYARANPIPAAALIQACMEAQTALSFPLDQEESAIPARATLLSAGFTFGTAVPIAGGKVFGAMEFFGTAAESCPPGLLETLTDIGFLLGGAMEREQVRKAAQFSENYFRHLVEDSLDLVTILGADGNICYESRSITTELGWQPEELIGQSAFSFLHPDDVASVAAAFEESLRQDGPTALLRFRFRHRDGSYRYLEGRGNNLLMNPAVRGVVFTSRDVTEKLRLEAQFGQLAGGLAHDFNNLLTVVVGYSSIMEHDPEVNPKFRPALGEVRAAAQRVASLTGQLLAFSGQQVLQPAALEVDRLVEESVKSLNVLMGSTAHLKFTGGAPGAFIFTDLPQLESVLLNFTVNARDAMTSEQTIEVTTEVVRVDGHTERSLGDLPFGEYAVISMRDTGCGMPNDVLTRIFEPYFTTKSGGKGSGLGLAACQGMIRQSHGKIAVTSEVGVGSTFSIYLPLIAAPALDDLQKHPAPPQNLSNRKTILFAEDEPAIRELAILILEEAGYRVISGEHGLAALTALAAEADQRVDLLLSDIMMPIMDGKELAARFRSAQEGVPILFCSGFAQDASFYQGLPDGIKFLPKPYTVSALLSKISEILEVEAAAS